MLWRTAMSKILVINGPNLNLLGLREPHIYGTQTLDEIVHNLAAMCPESFALEHFQSNSEGELITFLNQNYIQHVQNKTEITGIIINAGGLTHTSVSLRDALAPFTASGSTLIVEVHLSNIFARESLRHQSLIAPISHGIMAGFGPYCYTLALHFILKISQ